MDNILYTDSSSRPYGDVHDDIEDNFEKSLLENESKYKFARNIEYEGKGRYIYRDVILDVNNHVTYLHYNSLENHTRNIRNEYILTIQDNKFSHEDLVTIFTNIDYIIAVIKKRIIRIFDKSYEGIENSFRATYNKDTKIFNLSLEYQIMDQLAPDYKNIMITEIIIGTMLDAAIELKDTNPDDSLTIVFDKK